jgi:hypothetical protein
VVFELINSTAPVPATITNSIVAGNTGSSITFVPSPDLAYFSSPEQPILIESSLIGEIDAALLASLNTINSLIGTLGSPIDALIGPLANNGGPTQTHALLPGSPTLMAGPIGTAAPFYDYRLDTFADSQGAGIDLTTLGGDGTLNGGVYEFGMNQGLETQILAANADDYSVELFFKFDNIDATTGYQKILEFGTDTHPDAGLYVFNNRLRYFVVGPIGFYTSSTNLSADTWYHLVLTRDNEADNPLRSYIDGQLQTNYTETFQGHTLGSFTAEGDSSATKVVQLFHSDTSFGQQQGGAVDQVRYYDHPLSSGEVADLFNVGPNTMVPDFDQRGLPRQAGTSIDIGAYEAQITPSADFDTDSDVDGADFLRWQRGFGTSNAMLVDGNSDDDMDTDASDLAAWEVSFGQPQTLAAFNSQPSVAGVDAVAPLSTPAADLPAADLIDAAIVLTFDNGSGRQESDDQDWLSHEPTVIETAFAASEVAALGTPARVSDAAEWKSSSKIAGKTAAFHEPWLTSELLERVFG